MNLSLGQRLFIITTIALAVLLSAAGLIANELFTISLESMVREKLRVHTFTLLRDADNINGDINLPRRLDDIRFNKPGESLLALVKDEDGVTQWHSLSAAMKKIRLAAPNTGQWLYGRAQDNLGNSYYTASYSSEWPDEFGRRSRFVFNILENTEEYDQQLRQAQWAIGLSLFFLAIFLLCLQLFVLRLGLKPLRLLSHDVQQLNTANLLTLPGSYSKELNPIADDVNSLIENERRQRQRFQDRMADLSHSLKTPLSVLQGVSFDTLDNGEPLPRDNILTTVARQSERMASIINHQLQRAVTSHASASFVAISLLDIINPIIEALSKVYVDKSIETKVFIDNDIIIYADENDALEVFGNLLDNAFKYGRRRVQITANHDSLAPKGKNNGLSIIIEDDGPGIPRDKITTIVQRGVRLDTTTEGQGFGLPLVVEILDSYGGSIDVETSTLGGAKITVSFNS